MRHINLLRRLILIIVVGAQFRLFGIVRKAFHPDQYEYQSPTLSLPNSTTSTSRVIQRESNNGDHVNINQNNDGKYGNGDRSTSPKQQLIFLAGPHKTGSTSVQSNLWKWSTSLENNPNFANNTNNTNNTNNYYKHSSNSVLLNWVWPVPPQIVQAESSDPHSWKWTPAKGFYPLIQALRNYTIYPNAKRLLTRSLFEKYEQHQIVGMYTDYIHQVWNNGYDIIMGTEATDFLVIDSDGVEILNRLVNILPTSTAATASITGINDVTMKKPTSVSHNNEVRISIVIMYRTPKARHLISLWHQNSLKRTDPGFYDWMNTTRNDFGSIDALGMVDLILRHPAAGNWNVVLVDLSEVKEDGWDLSNFIACKVMNAECDSKTKGLVGLSDEERPIVANAKKYKKPPDVGEEVLERIEVTLREYDCNYQHLFFDDKYKERLQILYPFNILQLMEDCKNRTAPYPPSRKAMKEEIVKIVLASDKIKVIK